MAVRRKSIGLFAHERQLLVELYLRWRIPIDQFDERPDEAVQFISEWKQVSGRDDTLDSIIHYMKVQRKRSLWVRFDGDHKKSLPKVQLSADETEQLVDIFYENVTLLEHGSDVLSYLPDVADFVARIFSAKVGRTVPAHLVVSKLTALRKRGLLPKVGRRQKGDDAGGFSDIADVG
jgi:hypothetical protein